MYFHTKWLEMSDEEKNQFLSENKEQRLFGMQIGAAVLAVPRGLGKGLLFALPDSTGENDPVIWRKVLYELPSAIAKRPGGSKHLDIIRICAEHFDKVVPGDVRDGRNMKDNQWNLLSP